MPTSISKALYSARLKAYYTYLWLKCSVDGLQFVQPNFAFFAKLLGEGIAIDVGVGEFPDFAEYIIANYGLETYIIDPTLKHSAKLRKFESDHPNSHYFQEALGSANEQRLFYESQSNESGSLITDHVNIQKDPLVSYEVQVITLNDLLKQCGDKQVDIIKIDIEGEEYNFINSIETQTLKRIRQMIIEFHHGIISRYSFEDTVRAKKKVEEFGMKAKMYNGRDCLFYWNV